jgi:hypothetical protein
MNFLQKQKHGLRTDSVIELSIIEAQSDSEKLLNEKYMATPATGKLKMLRPYEIGLSGIITQIQITSFSTGGLGEDTLLSSLLENIQTYGVVALPEPR